MATLPELNREAVRSRLAQQWSQDFSTVAITKVQLKAAVDAIDTFFSDNAATINNALPAAAKAGLTTAQKAFLLSVVLEERYWGGV